MRKLSVRRALPALICCLLLFNIQHACADASASATLSSGSISITPDSGSVVVLTNWSASAYIQTSGNGQYDFSNPTASASGLGDYSSATATATVPLVLTLNINGQSSATAHVPGQTEASDSATAQASMESMFMIVGGAGPVNVSFGALVSGAISVLNDNYGQSAFSEDVFTLSVDGTPAVFFDNYFQIGPSDSDTLSWLPPQIGSMTLDYNTPYSLGVYLDSEAIVSNIPEPQPFSLLLFAMLCGYFLVARKHRAAKKCQRIGVRLAIVTASLWFAGSARALYIGADAPDACQNCGVQPTRQAGESGSVEFKFNPGFQLSDTMIPLDDLNNNYEPPSAGPSQISYTEGNLREEVPVTTVKSSSGPMLDLKFTYNSYDADNTRAQINVGMGPGWTHNYNETLFQQRGHMFQYDSSGRVTLYRFTGKNTYVTDSGYFESLYHNADGSFSITNKQQSYWHFSQVPGTPYFIGGPIWRLTDMGDRNGNVTSLTYSNGLLTQVTDPHGRSLYLGYTNNSKLTTIADPLGRVTRIQYDSLFRAPIMITDPAGRTIRYNYNSQFQMTRKTDRDGRIYFYTYKNQKPYSSMDGMGQTYFSVTNSANWSVNQNALSLYLRRQYVPSTTTSTDGRGNILRYQYDTNGYITQATYPDGAVTRYAYDGQTRQISIITNANGAITRYHYDGRGNRTNATDAIGNVTTYTYDPVFNQITSLTDPNGRVTTYQYDSLGNRTNMTDALTNRTTYTYDPAGNLTSRTDPLGRTTTYAYDSYANRTNVTDPLGNTTSYAYDGVGNLIRKTDANGNSTQYAYDSLDRLTHVTNALGGTIDYTYDSAGRRTSTTDRNGNTTTYDYDTRGHLAGITNGVHSITTYTYDGDGNRISTIDPRGNITTYSYDSRNRLTQTTDALGGVSTNAYDSVGNMIERSDANGNITTYSYDALNRRVTTTNDLGYVTRYSYSDSGGPPCCSPTIGSPLVTEVEDGNGKVTYYKYDADDRLTQTIRKQGDTNDVIDSDDSVTRTFYDRDGEVTEQIDPLGHTTTTVYDADGETIEVTNAAMEITRYYYDGAGNLTNTTYPNGNVTTYDYDGLNRQTSAMDEVGKLTTTTYDGEGNITSVTDGNIHTTTYDYDGDNRVTEVIDPLGKITTYQYDEDGEVTNTTDRLGNSSSTIYDGLNRRTETIDALGNQTFYAYDSVGNLTNVTDANGHGTTYTYDGLNRRITQTYPDPVPNTVTYTYDAVGNLIERVDQKGQTTTYQYDDIYDRTNRTYSPSGMNDVYTYDRAGRLLSAERGGWTDTFAYDPVNRLTNSTQGGSVIQYQYDVAGRTRTTVYPSGRTITDSLDARDRISTLDDGTPLTTYTYDAADRTLSRSYRNGVTAIYTYDDDDRILTLEHMLGITRIAGFSYAYDAEGNRYYEEKRHLTSDSEAYTYDALNRLITYDVGSLSGLTIPSPSLEKLWSLDPVGNWNVISSNTVLELRLHAAANELTNINGSQLLYDANGNLQQDLRYTYDYDEENRLTQVTRLSDSAIVGQYWYDALGRRIIKLAAPSGSIATNIFLYDRSSRIVEELDGGGGLQADYIYGNCDDERLAMIRGGQFYYYHENSLRSPHALTDAGGSVVERYTYDAYGQPYVLDGSFNPVPLNLWDTAHSDVTNAFLFHGALFDEETGLFIWFKRFYDTLKGRFLQRDGGLNAYEVASSNPVGSDIRPLPQLTATERLNKAGRSINQISAFAQPIATMLNKARQQGDAVEALCLNDKLSHLHTILRSAQERMSLLRSAADRNDTATCDHELYLIDLYYRRAAEMYSNAMSCVGAMSSYAGETENRVDVDPAPGEVTPQPPKPSSPSIVPGGASQSGDSYRPPRADPAAAEPTADPLAFGATGGGESFASSSPGAVPE